MARTRTYPNDITPGGTKVRQGFINDDLEIKRILADLDSFGVLQLPGTKRQSIITGAVDASGNPAFLTASNLNVSIAASASAPLITTFAYGWDTTSGALDYLVSLTDNVSNAWTLPQNQTCYLYQDRDASTGTVTYNYSLLEDLYQKAAPSASLDQHYYNTNDMKMYRYNGASWEVKQRIFLAKAVTDTTTATLTIYPFGNKIRKINNIAVDFTEVDIPVLDVRQTVLSSAVDTNGLPTFISAGTGLVANIAATTTTIRLTAANGFDDYGPVNRIGKITADTTIMGLTNSATISSITRSGTTATLTTSTAHGLSTGAIVVISGTTPTGYSGTYIITVTGTNTFTYTMAADPGVSASVVGSYAVINFLYGDIAADGTVTLGHGILPPVYQQGGTSAVTSGQFTFNVGQMAGYVGNGSSATQTYRVYIGEAMTSGGSVTGVVNYALCGKYKSAEQTLPNAGTTLVLNSNIGTYPTIAEAYLICKTAEKGYSVGDKIKPIANSTSGSTSISAQCVGVSKNTIFFVGGNYGLPIIPNKTTGVIDSPTSANWKLELVAGRGW